MSVSWKVKFIGVALIRQENITRFPKAFKNEHYTELHYNYILMKLAGPSTYKYIYFYIYS